MPVQWEHKLTATQRLRIDDAERKFYEALDAHEKMREIFDPGEWTSLGPERDGRTKAEEIKKLERDIKQFAIDTLRVLAEAAWSIGSLERFRARIETDASDTLARALAKVNPDDSPHLDTAALETALSNEVSKWVVKAQREFLPPWKAMATTPAPSQAPDAAAPEIIKAQESKGHVEAAVAPNVLPTPAGPLEPQGPEDSPDTNVTSLVRKKRGRPTEIPDERKRGALAARGGKARAQILYATPYPTPQQVKNVSSILKHYLRKGRPNQG